MHDALVGVAGSLRKAGETLVAPQRCVIFIRIASNNEVGIIVKPTITLAAKSESVLTPFHREGRNFITSSIVVFVVTGGNTMCGLSPVVCSSSRHLFVRSCLSQGATMRIEVKKAFQFFPNDSGNRRNMKNPKKLKKRLGHMSKNADAHCMLFLFVSHVNDHP